MDNTTAVPVVGPAGRGRAARIGLGVVLAAEVLMMGVAGSSKFTNAELWRGIFEGFGYPAGMAPVVGAAEMVLVLLLLVPRLSSWAAIGLGVIMVGALQAVLTHPNDLGPVAPAMHLALLAIIGWARWGVRWRPE